MKFLPLRILYKSIIGTIATITLISLIAAFALSRTTRSLLQPQIDANVQSYLLLSEASESGSLLEMKLLADQAYGLAVDEDLRKMANLLSRSANHALECGVNTHDEADSFEGCAKAFIAGLVNPMLSVRSLGLSLDLWLTDVEVLAENVDRRYLPILHDYSKANSLSGMLFWIILITLFIFLIWKRDFVRTTLARIDKQR